MPFIGKMPVFKKQMIEKKNEDQQEAEKKEETQKTSDKQRFDEKAKHANEKWEDLMPDPLQFSAMMNSASNQHEQQQPPISMANDELEIPPGLDPVSDYDQIPKPISDAPPLKTGPLPKDFQATLDLLFDGDKPKKAVIETPISEPPKPEILPIMQPTDGPQMIMPEELSQHAILYGNFFPQSTNIQPVPPPPPITENTENEVDDQNDSTEMIEEPVEKFGKSQEDIDDLALLGIDVNDVGSGLW